jgi:hypothetical protein
MTTTQTQIETYAAALAPYAKIAAVEGLTDADAILTRAIELFDGFAKFATHILSDAKRLAAYHKLMGGLVWETFQTEAARKSVAQGFDNLAQAW